MGGGLCENWPPKGAAKSCAAQGMGSPNAWARCMGGIGDDDGEAIAVGPDGSIFVGGAFGETIDITELPGLTMCSDVTPADFLVAGWHDGTLMQSLGGEDMFVAKLTPTGDLAWVKTFGGPADEGEVRALAVDPNDGTVAVAGDFAGTVMVGSTMLSSDASKDFFVADLNGDTGAVDWAQAVMVVPKPRNDARDSRPYAVGVDPVSDDIIVTGYFEGTATFGVGQAGAKTLTALGGKDAFVAEYDHMGTLRWADDIGGAEDDSEGRGVTVEPDGSYVVSGTVAGKTEEHFMGALGMHEVVLTPYSAAGMARPGGVLSDGFLVHYDHDGRVLWGTNMGYPGQDARAWGVTHDALGNLYVTGRYDDCLYLRRLPVLPVPVGTVLPAGAPPATQGCEPGAEHEAIQALGDHDAFLAKYDPAGILQWVRTAGGPLSDAGWSVAAHAPPGAPAAIYLGGRFQGDAMFGAHPVSVHPATVDKMHEDDAFLAKYDEQGQVVWVKTLGGPGDDWLYTVATGMQGEITAIGHFRSKVSFELGTPNQIEFSAAGVDEDVWFARWAPQ